MSIEEAIAHCWNVFNEKYEQGKCRDCADEHGQLALWLEELLAYRKCHNHPNPPLTLEELREMGGEPYWHVGLQTDSPPPHWNILDPIYAQHIEDYGYGKRWLAYRRKPEEET